MPSQRANAAAYAEPPHPRNRRLDAHKGTAITRVALGHALVRALPASPVPGPGQAYSLGIGCVPMSTVLNPLFNVTYTVHMPLFAFVSGYLPLKSLVRHRSGLIGRRFMSLMVPYFGQSK